MIERNIACLNFVERRTDFNLDFAHKLYYGKVEGFGYIVSEDEFVDEKGDYGCDFQLLTNAMCNHNNCKECIVEYFTNKVEKEGKEVVRGRKCVSVFPGRTVRSVPLQG